YAPCATGLAPPPSAPPSTRTRPGRATPLGCAISSNWRTGCARWSEREKAMAEMDILQVLEHLPQRFPMLMIDRVKECEPGKRIVAVTSVSANEHYFQGHFPHRPIMPGVLILEAMPHAAGVLVFRTGATRPDPD